MAVSMGAKSLSVNIRHSNTISEQDVAPTKAILRYNTCLEIKHGAKGARIQFCLRLQLPGTDTLSSCCWWHQPQLS
jgi:hypothetical protein